MSDLKFQEIKKIHAFLGSRDYFMTHRELNTIFKQHKLDKYDDLDPNLVAYEVGSKRDRLDAFFTNWPNLVVSSLLLELLDEVIKKEELNDAEIAELEECKQIALNLRHRTDDQGNPTLPSPYFENIIETVLADLDKANQAIWMCMYLFTDYKIVKKF